MQRLVNLKSIVQEFKLVDSFYGTPAQSIILEANSEQRVRWDSRASFGWYDLQLSIKGNINFLRRYAGHIETSQASRSDPANGL